MNELEIVGQLLGLGEDDAFEVVSLCDEVDRLLAIEAHGYAKDTPTGRDIAARLAEPGYRARLLELALGEDASLVVIAALRAG